MHKDHFINECYNDYLDNVYSRFSRGHLMHNDYFLSTLWLPLPTTTVFQLTLSCALGDVRQTMSCNTLEMNHHHQVNPNYPAYLGHIDSISLANWGKWQRSIGCTHP